MCRYAEDCAVVMSVIARPDNRDMSVSDIPFNWNAQMDTRKLRVGYIEDPGEHANLAGRSSDDACGRSPRLQTGAGSHSGVSTRSPEFRCLNRRPSSTNWSARRTREMTNPGRADGFKNAHLIPAVDYLQSQRARMLMMMQLAEATKHVDVYLAPAGPRPAAVPPAAASSAPTANAPARPQGAVQRHSTMANSACYPAVAVPNGFNEAGEPLSISFFARPFGERELLAIVAAYQNATGFHRKSPAL